jgi:hypothetical protein
MLKDCPICAPSVFSVIYKVPVGADGDVGPTTTGRTTIIPKVLEKAAALPGALSCIGKTKPMNWTKKEGKRRRIRKNNRNATNGWSSFKNSKRR